MGFEPTIQTFKGTKTVHVLDHAATVIGFEKKVPRRISGPTEAEITGVEKNEQGRAP
jgi:hypothetical protein